MFSLCVTTLMFSVRSEIVITGVGMNSLCNFTKYYSCEISLNVNFKHILSISKHIQVKYILSENNNILLIKFSICCRNLTSYKPAQANFLSASSHAWCNMRILHSSNTTQGCVIIQKYVNQLRVSNVILEMCVPCAHWKRHHSN